uniref:Uncharacterized protein n=1 Tax=Tetraselmis chuii TaxID=63592 RepID=A0A7S1SST6_9CHLO|mmetsp:Transcript_27294/g.48628  ORF Transcript_27294/g.48628 Transcript_27294/m.48628 type:complete len:435 (+) Transcript_27294:355-1659(+)|eukprot:CAMPEP_0177788714 /NCGR_PEP_ID=MMETSP0491_2-20121128/22296_1 /TAXON_ID=63592 /ORGANISM="Tetraselmis chuii, Strain PLY429" /LENGTH=434 /DNA_ID=CAMNT_0019310395 /DNA_START=70 /DNA_END=1374 /DNA_ORIENTATION=+
MADVNHGKGPVLSPGEDEGFSLAGLGDEDYRPRQAVQPVTASGAVGKDAGGAAPGGKPARSDDSEDDKRWLPSLRWTPSVRVKFLRAIESVDITKHWRHGSKAAFWYLVLETFWEQQDYESKYKQPHINSLNMKFFEIYDAHMEGTGEAGPSGSGARSSRNKLAPKDLTREENDICMRIKEKFEPIRGGVGAHKQPRAKLGEVGPGAPTPASSARKRKQTGASRSASTSRQTSALQAEERATPSGPTGLATQPLAAQHPQSSTGVEQRPGSINAFATAAAAAAGGQRGYRHRNEELLFAAGLGGGGSGRHHVHRSPSDEFRPQGSRPTMGGQPEPLMGPLDSDEYLFLLLESRIHTFVEKLGETIDVETERHGTEASIWLAQEEFSRRKVALLADHLEEAAAQRSTLNSLIRDNRMLLETILLEHQNMLAPGRT